MPQGIKEAAGNSPVTNADKDAAALINKAPITVKELGIGLKENDGSFTQEDFERVLRRVSRPQESPRGAKKTRT